MRAVSLRSVPTSPALPDGVDPDAWAAELWDAHGRFMYAMACALLGDETLAMRAVAEGMVDLARADVVPAAATRRALARHVYRRCTHLATDVTGSSGSTSLPSAMVWLAELAQLQRATLALCAYGGFTYTDAAELVGTTPLAVARLLTSGLAELRRLSEPVIVI